MTMDGYQSGRRSPPILRRSSAASAWRWPTPESILDDVAYLNAHGPGTALCDAAEARVLDELFPDAAGIFSVKPLVGHCQSAAAAVETLATIYSFQTGFVPAPPQVAPGHPKLVDGRTPRMPGLVIKSSLGMGGYNTAMVIAEPGRLISAQYLGRSSGTARRRLDTTYLFRSGTARAGRWRA